MLIANEQINRIDRKIESEKKGKMGNVKMHGFPNEFKHFLFFKKKKEKKYLYFLLHKY